MLDRGRVSTENDLLERGIATISATMEIELGTRLFLAMPSESASMNKNEMPFGEGVAKAFANAALDIEGATKCIALHSKRDAFDESL